jgi:hypothetical protein
MADRRPAYPKALLIGLVVCALPRAAPARAAGGPDVVDDAYAENPRICHIESWLAEPLHGASLTHLGIGCTFAAVPRLEIDAATERQHGNVGGPWSFQPGLKYTLVARAAVFAVGLSGAAQIDRNGRAEGFVINLPITFVRGRFTLIDLDLGCTLSRDHTGPFRGQATWGVQITQAFAPHLALIGEIFGVDTHRPGAQAGLRWSPGPEKVDIDLRASQGAVTPGSAVTLGVTLRV